MGRGSKLQTTRRYKEEMTLRKILLVFLFFAVLVVPASAQIYIVSGQLSNSWTCSLDGIGATLTQCQAIPTISQRHYLTNVVAQSTTATAGLFILRSGTGTNCGTATTSLLPGAATVARFAAPANTATPLVIYFINPVPAPIDHAICVLGVATNTTTIQLSGFT